MIYLFLKDDYEEIIDLENYASSEEGLKLLAKKNIERNHCIKEFISMEINTSRKEVYVIALGEDDERLTGTYSFLILDNIE